MFVIASLNPNPSHGGQAYLVLNGAADENIAVILYGQTGQKIWEGQILSGSLEKQLNLSGLALGVYTIWLNSIHCNQVIKWVVQ